MQKVPLSLRMLIQMCENMHGWPLLSKLSFDNLVWASASCVVFLACLRGRNFSFSEKHQGQSLLVGPSASAAHQIINMGTSRHHHQKTRKDLISIPAIAASPGSGFIFDPVLLLERYWARAVQRNIKVLGKHTAFKSKMVNRLTEISWSHELKSLV